MPWDIPQGMPQDIPKGIPLDTLNPLWPPSLKGRGGKSRQIPTYPKIFPPKYIHTYPPPNQTFAGIFA